MVSQISVGASPLVIRLGLGLCFVASVMAFDMTLNTNLQLSRYWGQNSYGAANSNTAAWQQPIEYYCGDSTIDTFPVAFLTEFYSTGNLPTIDLANTCSTVNDPLFPGTNLPDCTFLTAGIETCQKAGKIVTLSIGGATGGVGFTSDSEGQAYAQVIWDIFLGGSSTTRPFGTAVLDGIDMDIEGGSQTGYTAFLTALRTLMNGGNKRCCPYPDAYIGTTLSAFAFDAVYVQFLYIYVPPISIDGRLIMIGCRDNWAKTVSPNKNVKVYIGAPASSTAAGNGYVSSSTLATVISQTKSQYSSFGGVMLWDASQAYGEFSFGTYGRAKLMLVIANGRYDQAVKSVLMSSGGSPPPTTSSSAKTTTSSTKATTTSSVKATTTTTSSSPSATTTAGAGNCTGVSAWESNIIVRPSRRLSNQLWTAKWWTEGSTPGDATVNPGRVGEPESPKTFFPSFLRWMAVAGRRSVPEM
ncbi:glycoside hydrolase family 18 protein [Lanmaoa asiatica]|nr:glycoside hydrolase family 18 protein [Lanmaoa asiatica]